LEIVGRGAKHAPHALCGNGFCNVHTLQLQTADDGDNGGGGAHVIETAVPSVPNAGTGVSNSGAGCCSAVVSVSGW
jgi:hypothetical protein